MSGPRCTECGRQPGDGEFCAHCGTAVPELPASTDSQLAAVEAARRLLAAARRKREKHE